LNILFDQGTPVPLRRWLAGHTVVTAHEKGWGTLKNGDLIEFAENDGFDVLVTTDKNLKYQQNLTGRKIAIVTLLTTSWPRIQAKALEVAAVIEDAEHGDYVEIPI
jgi:predicted nuclease of predicted toxin-antitoxin system